MSTHQCYKCKACFSQKSHLDAHLNKKNNCEKCNTNFTTQHAYINGNHMTINEYIHGDKKKKDKIRCSRGHELVLVNGTINKPHFRHKNSDDVGGEPMTKWHCEWQGYFPVTEIDFKKKNDSQYKDRRADVLIERHDTIIEIQHSLIDDANVICRAHDYSLHNKELIWVIDGNTDDVILEDISDGSYLIIFNHNWKYKSFSYTYDFVLLDIQQKIFKISVKKVCNNMIQVKEYKPIEIVVQELLSNPKNVFDLWDDDNKIKAKMTLIQNGAGNGKTYGIWKSIVTNVDKELYIVITKQHSAKEVIRAELNEQSERNEFHIIYNVEVDDIEYETYGKQYIIEYQHKVSKRKCCVVIGTIDSFMVALSSLSSNSANFCINLVDHIYSNGCDKLNKTTGTIRYAGRQSKLDKHVQIWIDETQDLPENYLRAVIKLMLSTNVDVNVVGDKLQSLEYENNFMTCINKEKELPNIDIVIEPPININRRIKVKHMVKKINELINFKKYCVPEITLENESDREDRGEDCFEIINAPTIYQNNNKNNTTKITNFVKTIINLVDREVDTYGYGPKDFLFTFPIMKNNIIATELTTSLTAYWIKKLQDDDNIYHQYVVLHRHEEGQVIDTLSSINSSRIMSVRASKGDGRHVVFALGCTEQAIKLFSHQQIDIVYESYLHVALTRAKSKIYFGLEHNNDDIHKRFGGIGDVMYVPKIETTLKIPKLLANIDTQKIILLLKEYEISELNAEIDNKTAPNTTSDWDYHCIRHAIYVQYARFSVLKKSKNNNNFHKSQIKVVLDNISKLDVCERDTTSFYAYLNSIKEGKELEYLPLCNLSHKPIYNRFYNKIRGVMIKNQTDYIRNNNSLGEQSPLEAVIQHYMIDLCRNKKYHNTPPTTIYNIISFFESSNHVSNERELLKEAESIKGIVSKVIEDIYEKNNASEIFWNIEHSIKYEGKTAELGIMMYQIPIIGYDDENVYHLMFKTDYNQLNYWETIIEILLERFLINCPKGNDLELNNTTRFNGKNIKTYLFILKQNRYELFDWNWDILLEKAIKEECKKAFVKHLSGFSKQVYDFYTFTKKDKDKWKMYSSPIEYIVNRKHENKDERLPSYVNDFFKYLHQQIIIGKRAEVIELTSTEKMFCDSLNMRVEQMCDSFFGLINDNLDDVEW